ncbi:MAG TPA: 2-amino-4-hydroxy-6-hydroxymethyldihydropteridine diphosphokinase [Thermoguttaceae bacterium]|nr:2-amino-4-hydroxy-6-hydroxymethyldihydropteridine diphosphokinase [Thermoguttaceae bacterium]
MPACLIGLGSNLGHRVETLHDAVDRLGEHRQIDVVRVSQWHETSAIGGPTGQPSFLNGAVLTETTLPPSDLLTVLHTIESDLGRCRGERWAPRTVDLDLLLYDQVVRATPSLVIPHPRMAWRCFVLQPAAEVAPSMVHPTTGWTIARLLRHLETALPYVALAGGIGAGKTHLARQIAEHSSMRMIAEVLDVNRLDAFYADPASHAWETELEFLRQRTRLLATDSPEWTQSLECGRISDFWFDQSLAFARVWLAEDRLAAFVDQWSECRARIVRPKLTVVLDAPADVLFRRVADRGRPPERNLSEEQLDRIRQSVLEQTNEPDVGPVLRLTNEDCERSLEEVLAAIGAMDL